MRLYLVRHGQSTWQLQRGGELDAPLTELGYKQSAALAAWLTTGGVLTHERKVDVATLWTSPLQRARETCAQVAWSLGLSVEEVPELAEAPFHVASFLPTRTSPAGPSTPGPASGDYRAFVAQVRSAFEALWRKAETAGPIMAITHGGVIKTMLRIALGSDAFCLTLCNAGINEVEWSSGRWKLTGLNMWDHLPMELRSF